MKKVFRLVSLLLIIALALSSMGCAKGTDASETTLSESVSSSPESVSSDTETSLPEPPVEKTDVRVGALLGPTGMGLVRLMEINDKGEARCDYTFTMEGAPTALQGSLINGDLDIAALPTNLAAAIYNKSGGAVKMIAVSRMSVLYVMQGPGVDVRSVADLEGKTLFTAGQGSTQEYVLAYLLEENGLNPESDLVIEFKSEHAEVAALLAEGKCDVALLPQPFATTVTAQVPEVTRALDITKEWEDATGGLELTMSCIVARSDFIEKEPEAVRAFVEEYGQSADFVRNNVDEAAELTAQYEIIPNVNVAKQAIPSCNIVCETGDGIYASVGNYLAVLHGQNPASVGGNLPDEGFYYKP